MISLDVLDIIYIFIAVALLFGGLVVDNDDGKWLIAAGLFAIASVI